MSSQLGEKPEVAPVTQSQTSVASEYNRLLPEQRKKPEPIVVVHQSAPSSNGWSVMGMAIGVMLFLVIFGIVESIILNTSHAPASTTPATTTSASNSTTSQNAPAAAQVVVPPHQTYNAKPPVTPAGNVVNLTLTVKELLISIAPGVAYHAWTFNGTVPGPVLRVRQGQTVHFTLINDGNMPHSIDFHAAQTPWNVNYQDVPPGKSFSFNWQADYPGVFMYHCGAPTVIYHMANGMYGQIIVDPANGWAPAQEYSLVQSEYYTALQPDGSYSSDPTKLDNATPDYVVFNGYANQYKAAPLVVKAGQRIRLFLVNAGPSEFSAFHVIGAIFSDVYIDGNPANHMVGNQTVMIPPGGGVVVELTIPAPGLYPFVTHSFVDVGKGALGVIKAI
ncbi:MAG TPA: multicopper oxidase domain-containing protein [Ktedonobacteraceae bacterium]|nr:multicopper oxidase domain-containing protein [Ktedonobacteraceae bacterium]